MLARLVETIATPEDHRVMTPGLRAAKAVAVGLVAGFLSGLFGVGGGILIVPGLVLVLGMEQRRAHGTSLSAIVPIAAAGTVGYASDGSVDWPVAGLLALGALAGAVAGTRWLRLAEVGFLQRAFAILLLVAATRMFTVVEAGGRGELDVPGMVGLAAVGLASGALAGLLGVGGGVVMVPGQTLLFGITSVVAKGTSLAVILPTAVMATWRNARYGNSDLATGMTIGIAGVVSAYLASQLSIELDPRVSNVLFALLLVAAAARMWLRSQGSAPSPAPPRVAGLVLAAGGGSRFGGPKALAVLDGEPLVARATRLLADAGLAPRVVVLGAGADAVRARGVDLHGCEALDNPDWRSGLAVSLDRGLDALSGRAAAVVITLVDQPLIGAGAIDRLVAAWRGGAVVAVATYGGKRGHPVLLDAAVWPAVRDQLRGDAGARVFLAAHPELVTAVPCDGTGRLDDVDTPDDLSRIEQLDRRSP